MKRIARALLRVVTTAIPVVIAACYGVPMRYKSGKVIDRDTRTGIGGIDVECVGDGAHASSYDDGTFSIRYDVPCEKLVAKDVDGAANGGQYAEATVPFDETVEDITIEMTKQP